MTSTSEMDLETSLNPKEVTFKVLVPKKSLPMNHLATTTIITMADLSHGHRRVFDPCHLTETIDLDVTVLVEIFGRCYHRTTTSDSQAVNEVPPTNDR